MLYGYTCLNMKSFYSILASFIFWPEDTSPNFTKEGGLISANNFVNFHLMHPVHQTNNDWRKSFVSLGASATSDNRSFRFTTVNSTGQALINKAAQKDNTTSIYCQIQHTSNSSVTYAYVNARGGYSENPTSAWAFCNSAEPSNRYMSVGTQYFIYNSVKENGYTWAALSFKTPKAVTMRGEWSPDSVPQSGVVQI